MKKCKYQSLLYLGLFLFFASSTANCSKTTPLIQQTPTSAAFQINKLCISPAEAKAGDDVTIAIEVGNIGTTDGNYTVELKVNNVHEAMQTVHVRAKANKVVNFVISRNRPGTYTVMAGQLNQVLVVKDLPNSKPEILGENIYNVECQNIFKNNGPGTVTRILLRIAMITTREPYQKVVLTKATPNSYRITEDEYGNSFAEFEFTNIESGKQALAEITYQIVVSRLRYRLDSCEGQIPEEFLQPERYIESDNADIVALAKQITHDKPNICEKARAIYDWIGDNINSTTVTDEAKGALYCLNNKGGDCTEFSYLMIALCRAAGIPARLVEGVISDYYFTDARLHDWTEIYLPGVGWVPVDATLGRFKEKREQNFAHTVGNNIVVTMGNFYLSGKFVENFHFAEYYYWCLPGKPKVSFGQNWQVEKLSR